VLLEVFIDLLDLICVIFLFVGVKIKGICFDHLCPVEIEIDSKLDSEHFAFVLILIQNLEICDFDQRIDIAILIPAAAKILQKLHTILILKI